MEMWDGEEGVNEEAEEEERTSSLGFLSEPNRPPSRESTEHTEMQAMSDVVREDGNYEEEEEEEDVEDDTEGSGNLQQPLPLLKAESSYANETQKVQPYLPLSHGGCGIEGLGNASLQEQEPEAEPDLDADGDLHGESHPCQHCERHFSTKQGLERHTHIHATANQQTHAFKCRYCGKSFGSQVGRRRHERRHENGPKKKPGSLAGTAAFLSPVGQTETSSPDCGSPTGQYITMGFQVPGAPLLNSETSRREPDTDRPFLVDENGESKELHPCKYCNKAFGTHTNMRRHQRRIHERHLLPKGVRRKGMLLPEHAAPQKAQRLPDQSPSASPPPVYVPSADTEDEADREDYIVDISKNISENLSLYIDGKILSTSAVSSCEVIEVDSRSAALFGLEAVIISPNQISQALKLDGRGHAIKQVSHLGQPTSKRRTSTPPMMPNLKMETETGSSAASSSSMSSSSALLVGSLFPQSTDSLAFQREKTVYLSPKLKQLLQTQDSQKPTLALIAESHRLASPLSVTPLPGAQGKYKRRTASPPSSPALSPLQKSDSGRSEAGSSYTLKVPKLESIYSVSPAGSLSSKDEGGPLSPAAKDARSWPASSSGGNSCNQQPLDLSSAVARRAGSFGKAPGDSVLDLSVQRTSPTEYESKGSPAAQPVPKKKKPNTSMLEKVLMNEYAGLAPAAEDSSSARGSPDSQYTAGTRSQSLSPNEASESAHPSPPSLTPVTLNPPSPGTSSRASPTPPPPVLPTIPALSGMPGSPLSQPSDSTAFSRSLPVLSPKMSPVSNDPKALSDTEETEGRESGDEDKIPEPTDLAPNSPRKDQHAELPPVDLPPSESPRSVNNSHVTNGKSGESSDSNKEAKRKLPPADLPSLLFHAEPPSIPPTAASDDDSPSLKSPASPSLEPRRPTDQPACGSSPPPHSVGAAGKPATEGGDDGFLKAFVCNVCEEPYGSIKELSGHITQHAADWPYKCEFCVQLFDDASALLDHRTDLHGVGRIFVCSACHKEFAFLCNLQQHQKDLHPCQPCTHSTVESGKLRPQNFTDPSRAKEESSPSTPPPASPDEASPRGITDTKPEAPGVNGSHGDCEAADDTTEELYTTIKIMASEGGKPKGPDVRLGITQNYPSYKPPPFPYHSRSHAGSQASATNFTTHNIPQTFSTAIRCTKCGNSFDNMPELHQHILICANASDKKRYTPKKNPIPLKQIVKPQNGLLSSALAASAGSNAFRRMGQPKRLNFSQEGGKMKMSSLSKKKNQLVQKAISQSNKTAATAKKAVVKVEEEPEPEQELHVCPHCSRGFTYPASLSKHMAVSCPSKPAAKKGRKAAAEAKKEGPETPSADKNMSLRRRATDQEVQPAEPEPAPKPLGKTRARSSGAVEPQPPQPAKVKAPPGRPKRPASFPAAAVPPGKKSKKGQAQSLPPTPLPSDAASDATPQPPASKVQRMGAAAKKAAEVKSPPQQSQAQARKEERFSMRARERVGGPVTRSLQMATSAPAEAKTEDLTSQDPKESQEALMK